MGHRKLHLACGGQCSWILRIYHCLWYRSRELPVPLPYYSRQDNSPTRHSRRKARNGIQCERARFSDGATHRRSYSNCEWRGVPGLSDLGCNGDPPFLSVVYISENTHGRSLSKG